MSCIHANNIYATLIMSIRINIEMGWLPARATSKQNKIGLAILTKGL